MNNSVILDLETKFKISDNIFHSDVEQEKVILSLKKGEYYGLEDLGARIWNLLDNSKSFSEIKNFIVQEYEVESEECEQDLHGLLQEMIEAELIEIDYV